MSDNERMAMCSDVARLVFKVMANAPLPPSNVEVVEAYEKPTMHFINVWYDGLPYRIVIEARF